MTAMRQKTTRLRDTAPRFDAVLPCTPRGAREARRRATAWLATCGVPAETLDPAAHVIGELTGNAATHGRVRGRDFLISVRLSPTTVRIEVTDTRSDELPGPTVGLPGHDAESGRGLYLVEVLADRWGVVVGPVPRKTVWAELGLATDEAGATTDETTRYRLRQEFSDASSQGETDLGHDSERAGRVSAGRPTWAVGDDPRGPIERPGEDCADERCSGPGDGSATPVHLAGHS
ncbi:anti-sigma regulatory factor (Ser/Thr protein kinase) [Streptomyces sp. MJP52]|nr:anti-sigma regulatory factor (Ser/Thr protein kinase) [Streptomyces sp. MJP52]